MISIACELSNQQHHFKIFLPLYFTQEESRYIRCLFFGNVKFRAWLSKRTLPKEIKRSNLIRPFASLDFLIWVLKRLYLEKSSDKLLKVYKALLTYYLKYYVPRYPSSILICYDTIKLPPKIENRVIVICPMTHPDSVRKDLSQASLDYPGWPISSKIDISGVLSTSSRADKLILLSTYARDSFARAGFDSEKLFVLPIGPINGQMDKIEIGNLSKPKVLRVLFVGQMGLRKGVPALMELSHKIHSFGRLRLVGPCSRDVANYIREHSNSQTLALVQNPTPQELRQEFEQAHVFVMPSYNEGFGIACVEGMSFGQIPIISFNTGMSEMLIGTALQRFLIRPGSQEDILKNLEYISSLTENEYYALSQESLRISQSLTFEKFSKRFVQQFC